MLKEDVKNEIYNRFVLLGENVRGEGRGGRGGMEAVYIRAPIHVCVFMCVSGGKNMEEANLMVY